MGFTALDQPLTFWVAVNLDAPGHLVFQAKGLSAENARLCGLGQVAASGEWCCHVSLEDSGFLEREKEDQIKYVEEEMRRRVELARTLVHAGRESRE